MTDVNVGTDPHDIPGYPTKLRDNNGNWIVTEKYWQVTGSVSVPAHKATIDQHGATVLDPDGGALYCYGAAVEPGSNPSVSLVTLEYSETAAGGDAPDAGDNPRAVYIRGQEIPIDDERLLTTNDGPWTAAQIATSKEAGYKSLPIYSIEYTRTDADAAFSWSQADIIANLQTDDAPTGMGTATASDWRLTGREITENLSDTTITTHWEYMRSGFTPIKA